MFLSFSLNNQRRWRFVEYSDGVHNAISFKAKTIFSSLFQFALINHNNTSSITSRINYLFNFSLSSTTFFTASQTFSNLRLFFTTAPNQKPPPQPNLLLCRILYFRINKTLRFEKIWTLLSHVVVVYLWYLLIGLNLIKGGKLSFNCWCIFVPFSDAFFNFIAAVFFVVGKLIPSRSNGCEFNCGKLKPFPTLPIQICSYRISINQFNSRFFIKQV